MYVIVLVGILLHFLVLVLPLAFLVLKASGSMVLPIFPWVFGATGGFTPRERGFENKLDFLVHLIYSLLWYWISDGFIRLL